MTSRATNSDPERMLSVLKAQMAADGVTHLLVQFVDVHGAAKVKLVPAGEFRTAIDTGAGFAGGAVWGLGQGPHSHDLCARVDPDTYTLLPCEPSVARFAANLYVDGHPHPYCPRVNLGRILDTARDRGDSFQVGIEPKFFLAVRNPDGSIAPWDPNGVDDLAKPCYDFKAMTCALGFFRALQDALNTLSWGAYQAGHEDANGQ